MSQTLKAHLSLFAVQVIYALNYSIAKDLMPFYVKPFGLVMMRILGAFILFWLVSPFMKTERMERKDLKGMVLLAMVGVAINQGFFLYGLSLTKPINSSIIMVSNPIAVLIFTLIAFRERLTVYKVAGLCLGIAGALTLLLFKGSFSLGSDTLPGDAMILVNSLSWAVFIVMSKPYMQKYQAITVMKWVFSFGLLIFLPIGLPDLLEVKWSMLGIHELSAMAFVVIATTFLAYLLNTYALKALSASVVSMYIYLQPFLAILFAVLAGKDHLTPIKTVSGILITLGVYVAGRKGKQDKEPVAEGDPGN